MKAILVCILGVILATSTTFSIAAAASADPVSQIEALALKITGKPGGELRYAAQSCVKGGVPANSPFWANVLKGYEGLPVQDCSAAEKAQGAPNGMLSGRSLLLLPSAHQAAVWIATACTKLGLDGTKVVDCGAKVLSYIKVNNGLQFVIAGVIWEPKSEGYTQHDAKPEAADKACMKVADQDVLYSFRDGITVRLEGQPRTSFRGGIEDGCTTVQPSDLNALILADPVGVAVYSRISGIRNDVYAACAGVPKPVGNEWRRISRDGIVKAWSSDDYPLIDLVAKALVAPAKACAA